MTLEELEGHLGPVAASAPPFTPEQRGEFAVIPRRPQRKESE